MNTPFMNFINVYDNDGNYLFSQYGVCIETDTHYRMKLRKNGPIIEFPK